VKIGMPVRSRANGRISTARAAEIAAQAANIASDLVIDRRPDWLPALFCPQFGETLQLYANKKASGTVVNYSKAP
jgi:hypothetical protein